MNLPPYDYRHAAQYGADYQMLPCGCCTGIPGKLVLTPTRAYHERDDTCRCLFHSNNRHPKLCTHHGRDMTY